MDLQNFLAVVDIRQIEHHPSVKAARPQQSRIENIRPVRRGNDNDRFVRLEAIHFDEDLV